MITGATLAVVDDLNALLNQALNQLNNLDQILNQVEQGLTLAQQILGALATLADYQQAQPTLQQLAQPTLDHPFLPPGHAQDIQAGLDCLEQALTDEEVAACSQQLQDALAAAEEALEQLYHSARQPVFFSAHPEQDHGFDSMTYPPMAEGYAQRQIAGQTYHVPWKALAAGAPDLVYATTSPAAWLDSIALVDASGTTLPRQDANGLATLTLPGQAGVVYARELQPDTTAVSLAGELHLAVYPTQDLQVVIVPVNGATLPAGLPAALHDIFRQAVVRVQATVHPGLAVPDFDNLMDAVPPGELANYTPEMRQVIRAWRQQHGFDQDVYYLFVVAASADPTRAGYMPRGKAAGFVYLSAHPGGAGLAASLAHELAHGAYVLEHTFVTWPELAPAATNNLMDYAGGTHLHKYQWDLIHDPERHWALFDEEEEGAADAPIVKATLYDCDINFTYLGSESHYVCFTPSGELYALPRQAIATFHPDQSGGWPRGALKSFYLNNKTYWGWTQSGRFKGYAPVSAQNPQAPGPYLLSSYAVATANVYAASYGPTNPDETASIAFYSGQATGPWHTPEQGQGLLEAVLPVHWTPTTTLPGQVSFSASCQYQVPAGPATNLPLACQSADEGQGEVIAEDIAEMIELLNTAIQSRDAFPGGVRPKNYRGHLLATSSSQVGLTDAEAGYVDENLFLLKYHTQTDFFVIFHRVGEHYPREALTGLTQDVFAGSLLGQRQRALLVVIPYTSAEDGLFDINHCGAIALTASPQLLATTCSPDGGDAFAYLMEIFSCIPKPIYLAQMTQLCDGAIAHTYASSGDQWVTGYAYINQLKLQRSSQIPGLQARFENRPPPNDQQNLRLWQESYHNQLLVGIEADNAAIAQGDSDYWLDYSANMHLRASFIRDPASALAYAKYHFAAIDFPFLATTEALASGEITAEQVHDGLDVLAVSDQVVYPLVDGLGLIPGVDVVAEAVGLAYAIFRGDTENAFLYGASIFLVSGADDIFRYGGRGPCKAVATFTPSGVSYQARLMNASVDETVESVRASLLRHDPIVAQADLDADLAYLVYEVGDLYDAAHPALLQATIGNVALAKQLAEDVVAYCPLLAGNPQLLNNHLADLLARIGEPGQRKLLLETIQGFADPAKVTNFTDDLANVPELVAAFAGRVELVRAWVRIYPHANRSNILILTKRIEFDDLPLQWRKENPYTSQDMFDPNSGGYTVAHTGHNDYPHEFDMADAIAKDGKAVKLRNESTPDPAFGNKTPDADIDGIVCDFKNFDSPNNVNGKVYNHIVSKGSRSNAPGVVFNLRGNSASLADVNQGINDVRELIANEGIPPGMADQVGLVYPDGTVVFLSKDNIINGANF